MKTESGWITVAVCYNPKQNTTQNEFEHYFEQLPKPRVIAGDFNARYTAWEPEIKEDSINKAGRELFKTLVNSSHLVHLSPKGMKTRFDPRTGVGSVLDMFIGDSQFNDGIYKLTPQAPSDHQPIIATFKRTQAKEFVDRLPRWRINSERWQHFNDVICTYVNDDSNKDLDNLVEKFTNHISKAAHEAFKLSGKRGKERSGLPWWNTECRESVRERREAWKAWKKAPTQENKIEYNKKEAKAKRNIKKAKQNAWISHCETLSATNKTGDTWRFLHAMEGKTSQRNIPLAEGGVPLEDDFSKAELLSTHYDNTVGQIPNIEKPSEETMRQNPNISFRQFQRPFKRHELNHAIKLTQTGKAPGNDFITYEFIRNLPENMMEEYLRIINISWAMGVFPSKWKTATIIHLPKPNKDHTMKESYRPITFLSCLGKIMERMVERRLNWILESNNLLFNALGGFRPRRGTVDCLAQLEHEIRTAQKNKEVLLCIFLDLKSAFDTVPHQGVLRELAKLGCGGTALKWFADFLTDRTYQVSVGGEHSNPRKMQRGLPQGSILSPILFNLIATSIPKINPPKLIIYADDKKLYHREKTLAMVEAKLQESVVEIETWLRENELEVETGKSYVMCFTNQKLTREPNIYINGNRISYITEHKSLGLILDGPRLTWRKHIEHLRIIGNKRLDVMKRLSSLKWGTHRDVLLMYYQRAIKPKLEYGNSIYGSACYSLLTKLDVIHNTALRIASGAFRTSPINSISVETGVMNLSWSRKVSECNQVLAFARKPANHPMLELYPKNFTNAITWHAQRKPLLHRAIKVFDLLGITYPQLRSYPTVSPIPPWIDISHVIHPTLIGISNKTEQQPDLLPSYHMVSNTTYCDFFALFTDGSHSPDPPATAAAVYAPSTGRCTTWRLQAHVDVLTAELFAIDQACSVAAASHQQRMVIYTDSKSSLQLLLRKKITTYRELVFNIQSKIHNISKQNKVIHLQWIPGHSGIRGNNIADKAAKMALNAADMTRIIIPETVYKNIIRQVANKAWTEEAVRAMSTSHLGSIREDAKPHPWVRSNRRALDVALLRLRIGHCALNKHLHRINLEESPNCAWCGEEESIQHIFEACYRHYSIRTQLREQLQRMNVTYNIKTILGGGNYDQETNYKILRHVKIFLIKSGRLGRI